MKPAYQQRDIVVEIAARATPGDRAIAVTSRRRPPFHFNNFSQPTKLRYLPFIGYLRDWLSRDYLALSPTHLLPPPCPHLGNSNLQAAALHAPERPNAPAWRWRSASISSGQTYQSGTRSWGWARGFPWRWLWGCGLATSGGESGIAGRRRWQSA